ncbi:MAG: citrate transporter [Lachnospiraceae bacterium]|nr:citrate transporter [Lachnospiraceae bacterium]
MKKDTMKYVHMVIGFIIMMAFRFIPVGVLPNVTDVGLQVLGIFVATIYLWSTIDAVTSSLVSIIMLAFSAYGTVDQVIAACFGNSVTVQVFFLMIFMGGLTNRRLTDYIGRWILTRKVIEGRPWVFTIAILTGTYVMSVFIGAFTPILLFWPVLYGVFNDVGYTKEDKYPKLILIAVVLAALIGFPVPPYMSNGFALLSNYRGLLEGFPALAGMDGVMISNASYLLGCFTLGLLLVLAIILVMKFVFKPDVQPLKNIKIEMLERNPLPPMSRAQKIYGVFLVIFIFIMLVPSLLPTVPVFGFLNQNSIIMPGVLVVILIFIHCDGEPVLKFEEVMGRDFAWPSYWIVAAALAVGGALTNQSTGIIGFLNAVLGPVFGGMSGTTFTIVVLAVAIVLTNVCNSFVIGLILQPVVLSYCATAGVNPAPIITLLIFTVLLTAACTPAASPFAAMLFGNKNWLPNGDVYKYSLVFVLVETVIILVVGIPFISLLM